MAENHELPLEARVYNHVLDGNAEIIRHFDLTNPQATALPPEWMKVYKQFEVLLNVMHPIIDKYMEAELARLEDAS